MQTSRRTLIDDFTLWVGDAGDVTTRNRAETLLNRVLEGIWMKREWSQFRMPSAYEVATVASTRSVALPDYFGRVSGADRLVRNLTNGGKIYPISRNDLEAMDPYQGTSYETPSSPRYYVIEGTTPVLTQPSASGDALEVLSSSASDVAVRAYVEGVNTSGLVTRVQVTLTGTTPVAVGTFAAPLTKFGKAYPDGTTPTTEGTSSEGTVTLRKVSGSTTLQTLAPDQDAREHLAITLYPMPDAVYTIAIPIVRSIEAYFKDADPLPNNWRNAVFEKMILAWRAGDRDGAMVDGSDTWPALVDLMCLENQQMQTGWSSVPYGGGSGY